MNSRIQTEVVFRPAPNKLPLGIIERDTVVTAVYLRPRFDIKSNLDRPQGSKQVGRVFVAAFEFPTEKLRFASCVALQALRAISGRHRGFIRGYHLVRWTVLAHGAGVDPDHPVAQAPN